MRRSVKMLALLAASLAVAGGLAACSGAGAGSATAATSTGTPAGSVPSSVRPTTPSPVSQASTETKTPAKVQTATSQTPAQAEASAPAVELGSKDTNGFPTYAQLTSLTNFVSTTTVATMKTTQQVHSPTNYRQTTTLAKGMVTILDDGETYTLFKSLPSANSHEKADPTSSGRPDLYNYADQVEAMVTKSTAIQVKKAGTCSVAGASGDKWQVGVAGPLAKYVQSGFVVCTRTQDGALLSLTEGTKLLTTGGNITAAIIVTSIGGVPAFTPTSG